MSGSDQIMKTVLALLVLAVVAVVGLLVLTIVGAPVWIDVVVLIALLIAALIGAYGFFSSPGPNRREDDESE